MLPVADAVQVLRGKCLHTVAGREFYAPCCLLMHRLARGDFMQYCSACADAVAHIRGGVDAPGLSGKVCFFQECGRVLVVAELSGLPADSRTGFFGLHIHGGKACTGEGFSATEGHYNPAEEMHPMHAGDLPPLLLCRGGAYLAVRTDRFTVEDIIGRTVVVHSDPDDFHSQPAGNAGKKIACGVIHKRRV